MQSIGFKVKWQGAGIYGMVVHAFQEKTSKIFEELGITVLRDDTSIYDCGGQIIIGHRNGTTFIVDNSDYTDVTIEAVGTDENLVTLIRQKLIMAVNQVGGEVEL